MDENALDNLKDQIETRAKKIQEDVDIILNSFQKELLEKIQTIKDNEILVAIKALNNRLGEIEKRLPPVNED